MTWNGIFALLIGFLPVQASKDGGKDGAQEQIDEFKKFYKPQKSTHEKVEAI